MNKILFFILLFPILGFSQSYSPKRLLIFSKNAPYAYRHASIEHGVMQLKSYCEAKGYKVDVSENADIFTDESLSNYQSLIFLSANQDIFDSKQEAALQRYIRSGGGFAGIHSSTGVERNWSWFSKMIGGTFTWHPAQQNGTLKVIDKKHPSTKMLPARWNRFDEWYYFGGPLKSPVKVLLALDSTTFKSDKHTQNYPSAWYQSFENGKIFYTAGGHNDKDYDDPLFMAHVWGGIKSTLAKKLDYSKTKVFEKAPARLITLDPGHFHAALVQKTDLAGLNQTVHVYAPESPDLKMHLDRIKNYNSRPENPSHWTENVYTGPDFFEKMIAEKKGDIVVMSGNNAKKTSYILSTVSAGMHVLADKPMCINKAGFEDLKKAFAMAKQKEVLLYDIMTERSEIATALQREFSQNKMLFGNLKKGTVSDPSIVKESVHHFFKYVSGSPLIRPAWFMDTQQQGEGVVDVTTHLVDLVHWAAFPETPLALTDGKVLAAKRWSTAMNLSQFSTITGLKTFPKYLQKDVVNDSTLNIFSNGEIDFTLKDIHAKVRVIWNYSVPIGGDTHYSIMKGEKADLEIRQGPDEKFVPELYIKNATFSETELKTAIEQMQKKYPGLAFEKRENEFKINIPSKIRTGHEAHFGEVMERFLDYYKVNNLPDWEISNMLLKYQITTQALEMAKNVK
jgi:type 1 glutamine amidotransferase/predicted dehydrogenase